MTVGERIKQSREAKGLSQTELAGVVNISKQNLYKYENNIITNIPSDKIEAIAKKLDVTPAYLMGWNNDYNENNNHNEELPEELVILNRNAKKMTPEQRKRLLDMARIMFKEEFDD